MKKHPDAYGLLQWAVYQGEKTFQVVERDDGHIKTSSIDSMFSGYDEWPESERKAIGYAWGRVLDVGCGLGRHSLYLQEKGLATYATDISPLAIKICKERGITEAHVASIEGLNFDADSFDTILMLGGNFSLLGNPDRAKRLLKEFHGFTSDGGIIIINSLNPYKTDDPAHLEYHEANRNAGRLSGQMQVRIRYGIYAGEWLDFLIVSPEEIPETGIQTHQRTLLEFLATLVTLTPVLLFSLIQGSLSSCVDACAVGLVCGCLNLKTNIL